MKIAGNAAKSTVWKNAVKIMIPNLSEIAKLHAETEFEKYRIIQDRLFLSDYDKYMLELEEQTKSIKEDK